MTREEAIDVFKCLAWHTRPDEEVIEQAIKALKQEPKTGHWIEHPKGIYAHLVCDICLSNAPYDCRTKYCPNCGARMVETQESEG